MQYHELIENKVTFDEIYLRKYFEEHAFDPRHPLAHSYVRYTEKTLGYYYDLKRRRATIAWISSSLPLDFSKAIVLDDGCGSGWACVELAEWGWYVIGVDVEKEHIKMTKERARAQIR